MKVEPCVGNEWRSWVLLKHYARRIPPVQYAFRLLVDGRTRGCVTFGPPASPQVARSVGDVPLLELNRLVVESQEKNASSYLVSHALKMLPVPMVVVSYADGGAGHIGYIYQATNAFYCGPATAHDSQYRYEGRVYHPRTLAAMGITNPRQWMREVGAEEIPAKPKHRYLYLLGSRTERKLLRDKVRWPLDLPYPKGTTARHTEARWREDAIVADQNELFR